MSIDSEGNITNKRKRYTKEYCENNMVVIRVRDEKDYEILKNIFDNIHNYSSNMCYRFNMWNGTRRGSCDAKYYSDSGFEVIDVSDLELYGKKIIGYKFKDTKYLNAFRTLIWEDRNYQGLDPKETFQLKNVAGCAFEKDSYFNIIAIRSGVLDVWFEEVYEKETIKFKVNSNENFIVEISPKNFITVLDENNISIHNIDYAKLKFIYDKMKDASTSFNGWSVEINTIDIGCKKNISLTDIKKILDIYNC